MEGKEGPVVVYVMEVEDIERTREVAASSNIQSTPITRVMQAAVGGPVSAELLLDLVANP
jgi:hypothetical protein